MSLRARQALAVTVLLAVGVGAASWAAYVSSHTEITAEVDAFLYQRADEISDGTRLSPDDDGRRNRRRQGDPPPPVLPFEPDSIVQVIDATGTPMASTGGELPVDATDEAVAAERITPVIRSIDLDGTSYRLITQHLEGPGAVQIARDLSETQAVLGGLRNRLIAIGVGVVVVGGFTGWLVSRRMTRPLRQLTESTSRIADTEDLDTHIEVRGRDEVGRLASSFNKMLDALATSRDQQHRLVLDAGHELRTPLTTMRTNIELLQRAPDLDQAARAELLGGAKAELTELTTLVGELIELATDSYDDEPPGEVLLDELVAGSVERCRRRTRRRVQLESRATRVMGRHALLDRAVTNLLGNAHKFSPPGEPIEVFVAAGSVAVRDHGPGIPPEDREHIFDRFYRSTMTRTMPGSGLGLAIVQQIVRRHGGTVWVAESPSGGAEVGFRLPEVHRQLHT